MSVMDAGGQDPPVQVAGGEAAGAAAAVDYLVPGCILQSINAKFGEILLSEMLVCHCLAERLFIVAS